MYKKLRGIVLGITRHSDKINILSLYSDTHGRISLVIPAGGSTHSARHRRAALMPLSVIEADINFQTGRSMQSLGRFSLVRPNTRIIGNPVKSAVALFVAEFIGRALREAEPDEKLWHFLYSSILTLDATMRPANFHLAFLSMFTHYAGITPDVSAFTPFAIFDMREGRYVDHTPTHPDFLNGNDAMAPLLLGKLTYQNFSRWHITSGTRRRLLHGLIHYYAIHLPGSDRLKSLPVLHQLFA